MGAEGTGQTPYVPPPDPRFRPRRVGGPRSAVILVLMLLGGVGGGYFAAATPPHPSDACLADNTCELQRVYLAQAVKVVGGVLAGYLLGSLLLVGLPTAADESRRRRRRELYKTAQRDARSGLPTLDARTARAALEQVNAPLALPPAALAALGRAPGRAILPAAATRPVELPPAAMRAAQADPFELARLAATVPVWRPREGRVPDGGWVAGGAPEPPKLVPPPLLGPSPATRLRPSAPAAGRQRGALPPPGWVAAGPPPPQPGLTRSRAAPAPPRDTTVAEPPPNAYLRSARPGDAGLQARPGARRDRVVPQHLIDIGRFDSAADAERLLADAGADARLPPTAIDALRSLRPPGSSR